MADRVPTWHHHHDDNKRVLFCFGEPEECEPEYDGLLCEGWFNGGPCRWSIVWQDGHLKQAKTPPLFPHLEGV